MKLKNFIKKQPPQPAKGTKTFHTTLKPNKKPTRASEKFERKSKKRTVLLILCAILIFLLASILFIVAFFYNNFILEKIDSKTIISPGSQNVIELDSARQILLENDINIENFGYSSGSSFLTLSIEEGPTVYFSNTVKFLQQAEILDKILYSLKSEGKNARIIDLRYNRPIVKF